MDASTVLVVSLIALFTVFFVLPFLKRSSSSPKQEQTSPDSLEQFIVSKCSPENADTLFSSNPNHERGFQTSLCLVSLWTANAFVRRLAEGAPGYIRRNSRSGTKNYDIALVECVAWLYTTLLSYVSRKDIQIAKRDQSWAMISGSNAMAAALMKDHIKEPIDVWACFARRFKIYSLKQLAKRPMHEEFGARLITSLQGGLSADESGSFKDSLVDGIDLQIPVRLCAAEFMSNEMVAYVKGTVDLYSSKVAPFLKEEQPPPE